MLPCSFAVTAYFVVTFEVPEKLMAPVSTYSPITQVDGLTVDVFCGCLQVEIHLATPPLLLPKIFWHLAMVTGLISAPIRWQQCWWWRWLRACCRTGCPFHSTPASSHPPSPSPPPPLAAPLHYSAHLQLAQRKLGHRARVFLFCPSWALSLPTSSLAARGRLAVVNVTSHPTGRAYFPSHGCHGGSASLQQFLPSTRPPMSCSRVFLLPSGSRESWAMVYRLYRRRTMYTGFPGFSLIPSAGSGQVDSEGSHQLAGPGWRVLSLLWEEFGLSKVLAATISSCHDGFCDMSFYSSSI